MKYLVNRETKEHRIASKQAVEAMTNHPAFNEGWQLVEADSEGWIPWSGGVCPVPAGEECYVQFEDGEKGVDCCPEGWYWGRNMDESKIIAYRPILSETAEKEEKQLYAEPTKVELLFDRLKSAIAASESIPSIMAEIDALLPEGYCVTRCDVPPVSDQRSRMQGGDMSMHYQCSRPAKETDNANNR